MENNFFSRDFIIGLSLYFQQVQLSLLIIPESEVKEFVSFFNERIMPSQVISYILVDNLDRNIPQSFREWFFLDKNSSSEIIQNSLNNLPKLNRMMRLRYQIEAHLFKKSIFLNRLELHKIFFFTQF